MTTLGLNHINLRAHRLLLDSLKDFYCEILGFRQGFRPDFPGFGYWLYAQETALIHLSEAAPSEERMLHNDSYLDHFAFACSKLAEVEQSLQMHGIEYRKVQVPSTEQIQLFIQDPAGNKVELNFASADK
jgi:catechol 2,3-dioxygenase-like lactoylglutathione lyase family enzyme